MKANLRSSLIASSILSIMMLTGTSNAFAAEAAAHTQVEKTTPTKAKKKKSVKSAHKKTVTKVSGKIDISKIAEPATNSGKAASGVAAALQPVGAAEQKAQVTAPAVASEAPKVGEKKAEVTVAHQAVAPKVEDKKVEAAAIPKVEEKKAEAPKGQKTVEQKPVAVSPAKPVIDSKTVAKNLLKPNVSEEAANANALAEIKRLQEKAKSTKPAVHVTAAPAKKVEAHKPVHKGEVKIAKQKRPTLPSLKGVTTLKGPRTHKKFARHSKAVRGEHKIVKSEMRKVKVIPAVKIARRNETRVEARRERRLAVRREHAKLAQMHVVAAPQMDKAAFEYMECSKHPAGVVACMQAKIEKAQREVVDHEETRLMNCGELRKEKRNGDPRVEGMVSTTLVRLQNEEAAGLASQLREKGAMSNAEQRELKLRSMLRYGTIVGNFADELCSDSAFERIFASAFETNGAVSATTIAKFSPKQTYNPEQTYVRGSRRGAN